MLGWVVATCLLVTPAAVAQDDDTGEQESSGLTTWSVRPATAEGRDDRAWVELTLEPGESVDEYLAVRNLSADTTTFSVTAADGYMTDGGRFNMLPSDHESVAAGTWIDVQSEVTVEPGDTEIVPYTITVPEQVTPGDHPAGIAASVFTGSGDAGGGAVGVESRVGFRVMIRVPGDLEPSLSVLGARTTYNRSWNPFQAGSMTLDYLLVNDGNVRLDGSRAMTVSAPLVEQRASEVAALGELFVDDRREYSTTVSQVWPMGRVTTVVEILPEAIIDADNVPDVEPVRIEVVSWVMPWSQLAVAAALVLLVLGFWRERRRRGEAWEQRLEAARAEGRAAASDDTEEVDA